MEDKFDRHIGKGKIVKIGEDEFLIQPLGVEYLSKIFRLGAAFSGAKEDEILLRMADESTAEAIQTILMATLEESFPEKDKKILGKFALQNFNDLFPIVMELNSFGSNKPDIKKKLEEMRKVRGNAPAGNREA